MRLQGRVEGVLVPLGQQSRSGLAPDAALLETLGSQIGQFAERRRSDERLRQSEARNRTVLESATDCVITTDKSGRILEFNRAAERTFGFRTGDVLGRDVAEVLVPPNLQGEHREGLSRFLATGERQLTGRREARAVCADGREIPIEFTATPTQVSAEPVLTAFLRDIRDRVELERLKDELVSTVSHELRTPLTSMHGFVELLRGREYSRDEQQRFLTIVANEITRLTRLINDLLDVRRLELAGTEYDLQDQEIRTLLEQCIEITAGAASDHRFAVDIPDTPIRVSIDADRMRQVWMNLLSNAVKYPPEGGTVSVVARRAGKRAEEAIRNEGIGMEPEVVGKLFRKFYRAESDAAKDIVGTGLGLALVREIVNAHRGEIRVQSQPGVGSEFTLSLPLSTGSDPKPEEAAEPPPAT